MGFLEDLVKSTWCGLTAGTLLISGVFVAPADRGARECAAEKYYTSAEMLAFVIVATERNLWCNYDVYTIPNLANPRGLFLRNNTNLSLLINAQLVEHAFNWQYVQEMKAKVEHLIETAQHPRRLLATSTLEQ